MRLTIDLRFSSPPQPSSDDELVVTFRELAGIGTQPRCREVEDRREVDHRSVGRDGIAEAHVHLEPHSRGGHTGEEFDRVVNVNLRGNFNVLQAAGQLMVLQKSGSIVLFSSIRSLVTEPGQSVYSMTKAGIVQLVRTAATEWGEQGVRVNAVGPGVTETPLTAPIKAQPDWYKAYADKTPMKRWAKAEEMAGPTVFLLSDAASYVTGTILFADGGWLANDGRFAPPGM